MNPMPGDRRDPSDIRVDALARAINYLAYNRYTQAEALSLLVQEDLDTMSRVWLRLDGDTRTNLTTEAQKSQGFSAIVIGFLKDHTEKGM